MEFDGQPNMAELSGLLRDESPRCAVIVSAAFLDETLGDLLGDTTHRSFHARINDALAWGLLTQNEHDDLHVIRGLRNAFAHDLRVKDFDAASSAATAALKLWLTPSGKLPLSRVITEPLQRLLYVVGVIGFRLQRRTKPATPKGALPDPPVAATADWPPLFGLTLGG